MATRQRGEMTRAYMLRVAEECFARDGYDATSVAEICGRAGVTKGAFYHHFPSKHALFLDLLERWLAGLDAQMADASAGAATVPEGLLSMAERAREPFQAVGDRTPIFLEFWTRAARDPEVWKAAIAPYRRYRALFSGIVEEGIAEGTLRPVDPEMVAQIIVSMAVGVVLQRMLDPAGADWGEVAYEGIRMLLEGLQ